MYNIDDLIKKLDINIYNKPKDIYKSFFGVYIGDLLSWVMSKGKKDDIWITVHNNANVIAVASLNEFSCVILPEDIKLDEIALEKAISEEVIVLGSKLSSFDLSLEINKFMENKKNEKE